MDPYVAALQVRYGTSETWLYLRRNGITTLEAIASMEVEINAVPNEQTIRELILFANIVRRGDQSLIVLACKTLGIEGTTFFWVWWEKNAFKHRLYPRFPTQSPGRCQ
jgi:hypothetical protein